MIDHKTAAWHTCATSKATPSCCRLDLNTFLCHKFARLFWCSGNFRTITKKKYDMKIIKWLIIEFIVVITRRCAWRNAFQYLNTTKSKDRKQLRNCCNIRRNWPKWSSWNLIAFFCCYWRQFNFPGQLSSWMRYSYFIRAFTVDRLKSIA